MKEGFYEQIVTWGLKKEIEAFKEHNFIIDDFSKAESADLVHRYLQSIILSAFRRLAEPNYDLARERIIGLSNKLIDIIAETLGEKDKISIRLDSSGDILKAFFEKENFQYSDIKTYFNEVFPFTGLSTSELFTGSGKGVSLESELKKEMLSASEVLWIVSFIKFEGIRLFEQTLKSMEQNGKKVKILCTVYMGATDLKAIEFLSNFSNVEIKISYNIKQERLHAKSYLFIRDTGFHTAYIGSSNLSRSALTSGLEWNLKVTNQEIPHIIERCRSTFDTYWNDTQFELYKADKDHEKLSKALSVKNKLSSDEDEIFFFDIKPYPFQQEILDRLEQCRLIGQSRNLIVAATGTGKTIIAAFDFKRFLKKNPSSNFLFLAHREEILKQARNIFRHILKDVDFGELWCGGIKPISYKNLFVSVQTLNNRIEELSFSKEFYSYIIVDEVHHSSAPSYTKVLKRFTPQLLLGLTATPERHDGVDITELFGNTISAEIRLPEALNRGLLCPFQYFGITDNTDISRVSWRKGRYDINELEKIYSEDNRRVRDILNSCKKYLLDFRKVCAIGFCVSQRHAEYMASEYKKVGLKSEYLVSSRQTEDKYFRKNVIDKLKKGEINYLFVVDILNEGIDIPEVNTLLFLRPTESLTIFLQQLGRGLRLHEGKSYLTVLDFVGQQNEEYSFEHKFRGMLGKTQRSIADEIENEFPRLPIGCSIILEKTAKEIILNNIRKALRGGENKIISAIRKFKNDYTGELALARFSSLTNIGLEIIYKCNRPFFELVAVAENLSVSDTSPHKKFAKIMGNGWLSMDSPTYFEYLIKLVQNPGLTSSTEEESRWLLMCYVDINNKAPECIDSRDLAKLLANEWHDDQLRLELIEYFKLRISESEIAESLISLPLITGLRLHGRYHRRQILVGMQRSTLQRISLSQTGVERDKNDKWEILFVTLDKNTIKFNPSTMYHDYFINEEYFHWQSQNATSEESIIGQSYINHKINGKTILLFIREASEDERGLTMSFHFCGPVEYVSHVGSKPMSITWRLKYRPPGNLYNDGRKLAIG